MAVTFVRVTEGSIVDSALTLNIEVSAGEDRVLVVGLAYRDNNPQAPNSIVFNGTENFTLEKTALDSDGAQCFLYYLVNPSVTTADVVITMPGSMRMVGYVAYFTGVNQNDPFTAETAEAQGNNDAPTVNINSAADEICIDIMVQVSAGPDTAVASHTEICNGAATGGGTDTRGCGQYVAGQAVRTMSYAMSDSDDWNIIAGALQEPAAVVEEWLAGISEGAATVTGAIKVSRKIAGIAAGVATPTGAIKRSRIIKGISAGVSAVIGSLSVTSERVSRRLRFFLSYIHRYF